VHYHFSEETSRKINFKAWVRPAIQRFTAVEPHAPQTRGRVPEDVNRLSEQMEVISNLLRGVESTKDKTDAGWYGVELAQKPLKVTVRMLS
jgi:hypothetical protein